MFWVARGRRLKILRGGSIQIEDDCVGNQRGLFFRGANSIFAPVHAASREHMVNPLPMNDIGGKSVVVREVVMRRLATFIAVAAVLLTAATALASDMQVNVKFVPVANSGVHGHVQIVQRHTGGTNIHVQAKGLIPGARYVSLYYGNHTCTIEPYGTDDVVGGNFYVANANGVGHINGRQHDDLDEINSVSVRYANTFALVACADIHPAP